VRHRVDGLVDAPALIGIEHQRPALSELGTHKRCPADVALEIMPDLHLHVGESVRERTTHERKNFLVLVAEPPGRGRVGRVSGPKDLGLALAAGRDVGAQ
jgi:hypothetical protein